MYRFGENRLVKKTTVLMTFSLFITFELVFAESSRNGCTDSSSGKRA